MSYSKLSDKDKAIINSIFNPNLPFDFFIDVNTESESEVHEDPSIINMERLAIKYAEGKDYSMSLNLFEELLKLLPQRAATFNNRAQVYRLMGNDDAALSDLEKAIELSEMKGITYCQALCQRGVLYRKLRQDEKANEDFKIAAKLGNVFAKQQVIEMNPYAALCNQMLHKAMNQLNK